MKNKGFTLIELLAVIVILAIIALIATPIIINIINESQEGAKQRSQELVYSAVELAYQTKYALKGSAPTLEDVMVQLERNGIKKAKINRDARTIETSDDVKCTLRKDESNILKVDCEGAHFEKDEDKPTLSNMILG